MKPPPRLLDGATVRFWSQIDERHQKTTAVRLFAEGREQLHFSGIALADYENSPRGAYVFYCDSGWEVLNDSLYEDIPAAKAEAERQFAGLVGTWEKL